MNPTVYPPLIVPPRAAAQHDAEILSLLAARPGPSSVAMLFDGFRPRWALDAADRLLMAGMVRLHIAQPVSDVGSDRYEVTERGRAKLAKVQGQPAAEMAGEVARMRRIMGG